MVLSEVGSKIRNVAVIGCGIMGSGIAQVCAQNDARVSLVGVEDALLQKSRLQMSQSLERIYKRKLKSDSNESNKVKENVSHVLSNICFTKDIDGSVDTADLVVEAVTENLALKQRLFKGISSVAASSTSKILATNTSSLSVTQIGKHVDNKERFAGLHFFNPVPMMALVEVVKTQNTSPDVITTLIKFTESLGKVAISCSDTPGFIVNRLLVPYAAEAIAMLETGSSSASDIDKAMKLGAGMPMGPLELSDYVGLDTMKFILDGWAERFPDNPAFKCPKLLTEKVLQNKLGRKTGEGFYRYDKN